MTGTLICVETEAVLLARLGSGWLPLTVAVLVIVPEAVEATATTTVIVDEAPSARLPTFRVSVWPVIVAELWPLADW